MGLLLLQARLRPLPHLRLQQLLLLMVTSVVEAPCLLRVLWLLQLVVTLRGPAAAVVVQQLPEPDH
jgi:hypothetical protein